MTLRASHFMRMESFNSVFITKRFREARIWNRLSCLCVRVHCRRQMSSSLNRKRFGTQRRTSWDGCRRLLKYGWHLMRIAANHIALRMLSFKDTYIFSWRHRRDIIKHNGCIKILIMHIHFRSFASNHISVRERACGSFPTPCATAVRRYCDDDWSRWINNFASNVLPKKKN